MDENFIVTKANVLINSRYELSVNEQRLILVLASLVQPEDKDFKSYEITVEEFTNLLGIRGENTYSRLKNITRDLMTKVIEIEDENRLVQLSWLSSCSYEYRSGKVELEFSKYLKPYMLQLKEYFTTYKLSNILNMQTKYGIRLYEIMKSHAYKKSCILTIDEMRFMLKAEHYTMWGNFNQRVLDPAKNEINKYTDLFISYEPIKEGRKYTKVEFTIKSAAAMEAQLYRTFEDDSDLKYYEKK